MHLSRRFGRYAALLGTALVVFACGSSSAATGGVNAQTATSAADFGGMDKLVAAAKAEGTLNVIALPPDWANYGAIISGFTAKYGIKINSENPNGSSQDEVNAVQQTAGTSRMPDVLDIGMAVAWANTNLFAPYKVATWNDIPAAQKESTGLWYQDYGGIMSVGYDSSKVPTITSFSDLEGSGFKGKVALNGDPTKANAALNGVLMAALANGGSGDNIKPGVDWFGKMHKNGNFVPVQATTATVKSGQTPVVFDWDYLSVSHGKDVPTWKIFIPANALVGGYYAQAVVKSCPHPAAARLWEEYLYSQAADGGQNLWLVGGARPVEMQAMQTNGSINQQAASALPQVSGTVTVLSQSQAAAAASYVGANWNAAVTG